MQVGGGGCDGAARGIRLYSPASRQPPPTSTVMAAQLAEQILAVLWMDRCRQAQLLVQGGVNYHQVARTTLTPFIAGQRWGIDGDVLDDEGVLHEGGVLNFDVLDADHFVEELIYNRLRVDIERGEWMPIEGYIRRAEFFGGFPRGCLQRLPPGAPSR